MTNLKFWVLLMEERFKGISVFRASYLGHEFLVPTYPWEALEPYWFEIVMGITKILVYHKFSSNCYKDSDLWKQNRMGLEALQFADLMSRDLGVRSAVILFNRQASRLKYGEWMAPFYGDTPEFFNQLAQFGQLITNSMTFLLKRGYLIDHKLELGVDVLRPYWAPVSELTLRKLWLTQTFEYMLEYATKNMRLPNLKKISELWGIPRYLLIESGLTREAIFSAYRYWKEEKVVKVVKPKKEFKLISEEEQRRIAEQIVKRITE